jgi:uncharacterized membrane protein
VIKSPTAAASAGNSASLATPAIVVTLVLLLGATIYLWRARYIRTRTAYLTMAVLAVALVCLGAWMYLYPMAGG